MTSNGRSIPNTSRQYGDIIGSIISNGSGELEKKTNSSVSHVKQKFRERRRRSASASPQSRNPTPERRHNSTSPIRQYNERMHMRRPPTPDKSRNRPPISGRSTSRPPTPERKDSTKNLTLPNLEPFQSKSLSPTKRRDQRIDSSVSNGTLTTRVASQVSKVMKKTVDSGQAIVESSTALEWEQESGQTLNNNGLGANTEVKQGSVHTKISNIEHKVSQTIPVSEVLSTNLGQKAGSSSIAYSVGDVEQMKGVIQAQNEQIVFFEECMKKRSHDIDRLILELELTKKSESKLDLELEIHDVKYSMYDDYRRMMDRARLNSTHEKEIYEEESLLSNSGDAFSRIEHIEKLYEKAKLEAESRFSILQEQYNNLQSKMESPTDITNTDSLSRVFQRTNPMAPSDLLKNRIKMLESENLKYSLEIKRKEEELQKAKSLQRGFFSRIEENILKAHNLEKQTLTNKIIALETEIGFTSGNIDDKTRTRRYRALENNLNDYVAEIMGLEDQLKTKDKIISKLKEKNLLLNTGSEKGQGRNYRSSVSSTKWYEQLNKNNRGKEMSTKTMTGDRDNGATIDIDRKKSSRSSARIAMLRRRLDALANDHSSVGTEDTLFSSKTTP